MSNTEVKTYTGKNKLKVRRAILSTVLCAVFVALAVALEMLVKSLPHIELPQGGTISLTCLPLMLSALTLGPAWGVAGGALYGVFNFLLDGYSFSWGSFLFDYVVAFSLIGLSGLFYRPFLRGRAWAFFAGAILGMVGRYLSHCLSGAVFFADYAPEGVSPILYSFVLYNAPYCFGSLALDLVIGGLILVPYQRLLSLSGLDPLFLPLKVHRHLGCEAQALLALAGGDAAALGRALGGCLASGLSLDGARALLDAAAGSPSPESLAAVDQLLVRGRRDLTPGEVSQVLRAATPRA